MDELQKKLDIEEKKYQGLRTEYLDLNNKHLDLKNRYDSLMTALRNLESERNALAHAIRIMTETIVKNSKPEAA